MSILDLLCTLVSHNGEPPCQGEDFSDMPCIAIIGAGGKTTLMALLSRILPQHGYGVVTSTTTHIFPPHNPRSSLQSDALLLAESSTTSALVDALADFFYHAPCGHISVGHSIAPDGKMRGLDTDILIHTITALHQKIQATRKHPLSRVACRHLWPIWIIEADGAAGRPLKAHAAHEPVIPSCATEIIMMAGLDALGQTLKNVVHRPELAVERLNMLSSLPPPVTLETPMTLPLLAQQILAEIPKNSIPFSLVFNKEDCLSSALFFSRITGQSVYSGLPCYISSLLQQKIRRI